MRAHNTRNRNNGRANLGYLFIILGIVVIVNRLNLLPSNIEEVLFSWQTLLIAIGVFNLINKKYTPAAILITLGVLFIIPEFITIDYTYRRLFWPAALIIVGAVMIFRRNKGVEGFNPAQDIGDGIDIIDHSSIFGGNKLICTSKNFKGGRVTSIFGGSQINFQQTEIGGDVAIIDVFTMFGGSKFLVPQDWNVKIDVVSIFGGFNDKRFLGAHANNKNKTLVIKGFTIFGGGDVLY